MKSKKNENSPILNYLLSMGFIMFLIVIFVLMLLISRFVLSDVNPIGEHVKQTKDLLKDIDEVQKVAEMQINNQNVTAGQMFENSIHYHLNEISADITDMSYTNVHENKSIITLFFDRRIYVLDNYTYYVEIKNIEDLHKKGIIVFENDGINQTGEFISYLDKENIVVVNTGNDELLKISLGNVLGVVFYKNE